MIVSYTLDGRPQAWQRAGQSGKRHWTQPETAAAKKAHRREAGPLLVEAGWNPDGVFKLSCTFLFAPPKKAAPKRGWPAERLEAALAGEVVHSAKPDLDNLIKLVKDALNPRPPFVGAWADDARVVAIDASKFYSRHPRTVVTIERLG